MYPRPMIEPLLKNYKFCSYQYGAKDIKDYTPLTLIWFSDIHGNDTNLNRISKFSNEYKDYIDDVLCTGDMTKGTFQDDFSFWKGNGASSFLSVIGNHDVEIQDDGVSNICSPKETYEKYFSPYLTDTIIKIEEGKSYWYKDYPESKSKEAPGGIRLIGLDYYHWNEKPVINGTGKIIERYSDMTYVDKGAQQEWLKKVLDECLSKSIAVITATHSPTRQSDSIDCSFCCLDRIVSDSSVNMHEGMMEVVQNFINSGGEFICWLCGHTHQDWFTRISKYLDQLQIVVGTSSYEMMWRDYDMVYNTKYMDRFNIFSVEPASKFIRMFRIGADYDRHGRHIGSIVYDYKNKELVYNQ